MSFEGFPIISKFFQTLSRTFENVPFPSRTFSILPKFFKLMKLLQNDSAILIRTELHNVYLRRQQKRGLVQKARHLMDENSVSFQMFLILLPSITLGSESQIPVFKEGQSNT